jgi:gliding motility-associated-like protein
MKFINKKALKIIENYPLFSAHLNLKYVYVTVLICISSIAAGTPTLSLSGLGNTYNLPNGYNGSSFISHTFLPTVTLTNPPTTALGAAPQSVKIWLETNWPNSSFTNAPFEINYSINWSGGPLFAQLINTGFLPTNFSCTSDTLPMYNNSLATSSFSFTTYPRSSLCPLDTVWFKVYAAYFEDSNATNKISWVDSNGQIANYVVDSFGMTFSYINTITLPYMQNTSTSAVFCAGDTNYINTSISSNSYDHIDSAVISYQISPSTVSVLSITHNVIVNNDSLFLGTVNSTTAKMAFIVPASLTGNITITATLSYKVCGITYSVFSTYTKLADTCAVTVPTQPPWYSSISSNVDLPCETVCPTVAVQSFTSIIRRQANTDPTYFKKKIILQASANITGFKITAPSPATISYNLSAGSGSCTPITGNAVGSIISVAPLGLCLPSVCTLEVVMQNFTSINASVEVIIFGQPTLNSVDIIAHDVYDSSGTLLSHQEKQYQVGIYSCPFYRKTSNLLQPGNLTLKAAFAGSVVQVKGTFAINPKYLGAIYNGFNIWFNAPPSWTFNYNTAAQLGFATSSYLPNTNVLTFSPTQSAFYNYSSNDSFFYNVGKASTHIQIIPTATQLRFNNLIVKDTCGSEHENNYYFEYYVNVPYGTPPGQYTLQMFSSTSNGGNIELTSCYVVVQPTTQVHASMRARCSDGFYGQRVPITANNTSTEFIGELINVGNQPLKGISIFNVAPSNIASNDLNYQICSNANRGSDYSFNNYKLDAVKPVSTNPQWAATNNYTYVNPLVYPAVPFANIIGLGNTNFASRCGNTSSGIGNTTSGSIMFNTDSNFILQPLEKLAFYTTKMGHNGTIGDTAFNSFSFVCEDVTTGLPFPIISSSICTTNVISGNNQICGGCEQVQFYPRCDNKPGIIICNNSNEMVSKVKLEFNTPCFNMPTVAYYEPLFVIQPNTCDTVPLAVLPAVPNKQCSLQVKATLYAQIVQGSNQFLDSCSSNTIYNYFFSGPVDINVVENKIKCFGNNNASLIINSSGGMLPITYTLNAQINNTGTFTNLSVGVYTISVQESLLGCSATLLYSVTEPVQLIMDSTLISENSCAQISNALVSAYISGGTLPYTFALQGTSIYTSTSGNFLNVNSGKYIISVTDANNCIVSTVIFVSNKSGLMNAELYQFNANACVGNSSGSATIKLNQFVVPPINIVWNTVPPQYGVSATNLTAGNYEVTIRDSTNCELKYLAQIKLNECCSVPVFPTAFSPNRDETNEQFACINCAKANLAEYNLQIFDRWGNRVFETKDYTQTWIGTYNGTDTEVGTYMYMVRYRCLKEPQAKIITGDILLVR